MMKQEKLKSIRDYRVNPRSYHEEPDPNHRGDIDFTGEVSLTKQSEAQACDINEIMKRYEATGLLPMDDGRKPQYGDFSTMETFQEAQHIVAAANASFYGLPAHIRARFGNDPAQFLGFVEQGATNPQVASELVEMGLATERAEEPKPEPKGSKPTSSKTKQEPVSTALES
ncbi:MAG: internal scaffolding protein [Arizlama microvirus]|nr:MAG: internal scaffolding protein [Arizlama microvirus]